MDAKGSDWDERLTNDIWRFEEVTTDSVPTSLSFAPAAGGPIAGGSGFEVFAGSPNSDLIYPGAGGSFVYSGEGDDRFFLDLGGLADVIIDDGGVDTIVLPAHTNLADVRARMSADGLDLGLYVSGQLEVLVRDAVSTLGKIEYVQVGDLTYSLESLLHGSNSAPLTGSVYQEVRGYFLGGAIAQASTSDPDGDHLRYELGSISGSHSEDAWSIDPNTGVVSANFCSSNPVSSEWTTIRVFAHDGVQSTAIDVMVRWVPEGETTPGFSRPIAYDDDVTIHSSNHFLYSPEHSYNFEILI
jgi:hypothetical protein